MANYYDVGTIISTHALKGEVKIFATTDFPKERFQKGAQLFLKQNQQWLPLTISSVRQHKGMYLLSFVDYQDINLVEPFLKQKLYVSEEDQHDLDDGEYYYHDIVGMTIIDQNSCQEIGKVKEILAPGANDVWVIGRPGQKDLLLPFLKSVVLKIDVPAKKAYVEVPEGLDD